MTDDPMQHADASYREARRAAIRAHHPDTGGDAESLIEALRVVDERFLTAQNSNAALPFVATSIALTRRRLLARRLRTVRRLFPRRRKYIDITLDGPRTSGSP
ncbi:MAG: hypothetical protein WBF79_08785 [Rhodococcus sp. (in: high G+C Gram-positive bacteria)]